MFKTLNSFMCRCVYIIEGWNVEEVKITFHSHYSVIIIVSNNCSGMTCTWELGMLSGISGRGRDEIRDSETDKTEVVRNILRRGQDKTMYAS